jgi:prepilin-type N-terminal cleavage/methylation domain-containing protein
MRRGFTLVELLTVIAIIAILAAIIFPVAGTVRENARKSRCMSNLSQIFVALQSYKEDYRAYPPVLGAYAVDANGKLTCNPAQAVPFNLAPKPLGTYLKNDEIFYCPNNPIDDKRLITQAVYPKGHALAGEPVRLRLDDRQQPHRLLLPLRQLLHRAHRAKQQPRTALHAFLVERGVESTGEPTEWRHTTL